MKTILTLGFLLVMTLAAAQNTCSNPAGIIKQNTQPPANCYTISATDTVDICLTFTSPGSILFFPFPPTGMCSSIDATAVLYDSACNVVDDTAFASFVYVTQGSSYVWCLHYVCDGPITPTYCPTYFDFSALPVEWLKFEGRYDGGRDATILRWSTASELNNEYFDIERSAPGTMTGGTPIPFAAYAPVGRVHGQGTSNVMNDYQFTDHEPPAGKSKYRLKQVDGNGTFSYSNEVVIVKPDDEHMPWAVFDITGRKVAVLRDDELWQLMRGWYLLYGGDGKIKKFIR